MGGYLLWLWRPGGAIHRNAGPFSLLFTNNLRSIPRKEKGTPMSRSPIMLATLILVTSTFTIHLARRLNAQEKEKQASLWMKQKLSASQNILAGLTTADFDAIEKNAQSMLAVGLSRKVGGGGYPRIPGDDQRLRIREQISGACRARKIWTARPSAMSS